MNAVALVSYDDARFELRCAACGYGPVVRIAPDTCPMCRATVWEHLEPAPDDAERKPILLTNPLKYQSRRQEYLEAWWNVVNWPAVAERYAAAVGRAVAASP